MRSSFCKCLPSFWLAQQRHTGTVSGCHYHAAVTDAVGADVRSALAGQRVFVLPVCWAANSGDLTQLAYIFPASLDALCFSWVGRSADHGQRVGVAGAEGLECKSQPFRQIALLTSPGSLHSLAGDMNRSLLPLVSSTVARVCWSFGKGDKASEI